MELPKELDNLYDKLMISIVVNNVTIDLNCSSIFDNNKVIFRSTELKKLFQENIKVSIVMKVDEIEYMQEFTNYDITKKQNNEYGEKITEYDYIKFEPSNVLISITNGTQQSPLNVVSDVIITNTLFGNTYRRFGSNAELDEWYNSITGEEQIVEFKIDLNILNNVLKMTSLLS